MPYLRLHLQEASIEQKRFIAQNLIDITLRSFRLPRRDRYRISVEFVSHPRGFVSRFWPSTRKDMNVVLEVLGHDLTEPQRRAFAEEAFAMLTQILPVKPEGRIARLFGINLDTRPEIAFHFSELSPAISEPFVVPSGTLAA